MTTTPPVDPQARDPDDWIEGVLVRDAEDHAADYIADAGFTSRVMHSLPAAANAMPAWRRPFVTLLWGIAAVLLAVSLPGVAVDVARGVYTLLAAKPFSLSTLAFMFVAVGAASWTAAYVTLRD
jgi:hypothetical protein